MLLTKDCNEFFWGETCYLDLGKFLLFCFVF